MNCSVSSDQRQLPALQRLWQKNFWVNIAERSWSQQPQPGGYGYGHSAECTRGSIYLLRDCLADDPTMLGLSAAALEASSNSSSVVLSEQDMCFANTEGADQIASFAFKPIVQLDDPHPAMGPTPTALVLSGPSEKRMAAVAKPIHLRDGKEFFYSDDSLREQHRVNDAITATFCTTEMFFNVETKGGLPKKRQLFLANGAWAAGLLNRLS